MSKLEASQGFLSPAAIGISLFVVLNYGRMGNDFANGRLSLPLDLITLLFGVAASLFFCGAAFSLLRHGGSNTDGVLLFGLFVMIVIPFTFATIYLTAQQYSVCLNSDPSAYDIAYFSYVNFTTLGFGDFAPKGICKAMSALEAIIGYLFLGVYSALLVANLLNKRTG